MAAVQFTIPYPIVALPTNVGAPGAKLYFYSPGTTTIVPVYASSALTTQLPNPVVADSAGRTVAIWLNGANTYKLVIKSKSGAVLYTQDPYAPGTVTNVVMASGTSTVTPQSFGAKADGVTDDAPAIKAALAYLLTLKMTSTYGYSKGSPKLFNPASPTPYRIGSDIDVYHTLVIEWENGAGPSGGCAVWKCDAGVTGLRTHSNTSTGRAGETTNRGYSAVGTVLRNPFIIGGFTSTEGEFYGIQMRVKTFIYDPYIEGFQGDGIFGDTSGVDNINGSLIWNPFITGCRDGIYINQNNANACQIFNPQPFSNRRSGIVIENGYGGSIYGGNSAGNGQVTWAGVKTQTFNNGHVYGVIYGQETWCSTNTPPSTAVSNQGWFYLYDIGAAPPQAPQWVTAQTWRAGLPIRITGGSSRGVIAGHECESGQMPIMVTAGGRMHIFGGLQAPGNPITETGALYGGFYDADSSGIYTGGSFPYADNTGAVGTPSVRWQQINSYTVNAATSVTIGSGTALTKTAVYTPSITPSSVASATVAEQTFTVSGLTTADKVIVNPPAIANATGIVGARVSAADTLAIRFTNPTAGALTPTSGTYTVLAFRS